MLTLQQIVLAKLFNSGIESLLYSEYNSVFKLLLDSNLGDILMPYVVYNHYYCVKGGLMSARTVYNELVKCFQDNIKIFYSFSFEELDDDDIYCGVKVHPQFLPVQINEDIIVDIKEKLILTTTSWCKRGERFFHTQRTFDGELEIKIVDSNFNKTFQPYDEIILFRGTIGRINIMWRHNYNYYVTTVN